MKLTGYYMTAICKFDDGIKFSAEVRGADVVDMRNLLNLADVDGVV